MLRPLSHNTLTQQAAEAIKRFILQENLQAGDRLPSEDELCGALGVSRNIIREALTVLVTEGMIVKQTGRGSFVREFDRPAVEQALATPLVQHNASAGALDEFRIALEIGALELVAQHITSAELEGLVAILERYARRQRERKSTAKEDLEFHLGLLRATHNEIFIQMIPLVTAGFRARLVERPSALGRFVPGLNTLENHRAILEAIGRRDLSAAQAALRAHFGGASE